ncbi:MAG: hypothetical protein ACXV8Q_04020 [Methylobacter sp.]
MIVLRDPSHILAATESLNRALLLASLASFLQQRFRDMSEDGVYDTETHGYIVLAEPGDDPKVLDEAAGCPIFSDWFGDFQYPDSGFAPSFEYLAEYPLCYEMVFIANDSGYAILVVVPKQTGIDAQLLNLCRDYAEPAHDHLITL